MSRSRFSTYLAAIASAVFAPLALQAGEIDFNRDVRPILADSCIRYKKKSNQKK
ncbi:hypothetical protein Mal15_09220 [Stieleria maiorica]|uniref:Uncharacterized protein n=1 Tax=Stieleria maiorica TaxID=2795974 RepID=A0A5B9M6Z0_9BACT|nr:hypothetical protein Mal15_09220 [Stieleria maiorica]